MSTQWSDLERDFLRIQAASLKNQGIVGKKKIARMAMELNENFHQGKVVRTFKSIFPTFYRMRRQLRNGVEVTGRQGLKKTTQNPGAKQVDHNIPFPTPSVSKDKTYSSETLTRIVRCAKEIKKMSCGFCELVESFASEFEADRNLLRKLKKLREAAEEFKL